MLFDNIKNSMNENSDQQIKITGRAKLDEKTVTGKAKLDDLVVTRSDFPLSSYNMSVNLEKLMYCAMIVIRKKELQADHEFDPNCLITISAKNFGELTSRDIVNNKTLSEKTLRDIERKAEIALQRIYKKFDNPTMLIDDPNEEEPVKVPMMTRCQYSSRTKSIQIRFAYEFYEYFYNLLKWSDKSPSYSSHELKQVVFLESKYGVKLYNILNSHIWRVKELEYDLDKLRWLFHCFEIGKGGEQIPLYTELYNFKKRVLDVACEDINTSTNIRVTYENIKEGKVVVGIRFKFDYTDEYKRSEKIKTIQNMKERYLKNAIPFSDDGSHFKPENGREQYFVPPKTLTSKQISVLVNCEKFLSDYEMFVGSNDTESAKRIMRDLLTNHLDKVNKRKKIDLDYYFWIQANNGLEIKSNQS